MAHTANDAVDVIDCATNTYLRSIPHLRASRERWSPRNTTWCSPDTETMRRLESAPTERGAHTIGFDAIRNTVYAFLPDTHRAAVYLDEPG